METSYETETKNKTASTWAGFWYMIFVTSLMVAVEHGRHGLGIELNPEYIELAHSRIAPSVNLFTGVNQSTETLDAKEDTNAHNNN